MASAPPSPARFSWVSVWMPIISALAIVIGGFLSIGGTINDVRTLKEDMKAVKAMQDRDRDAVNAKLEAIQITTTRTDATLQALRDQNGGLRK